jgi:hypothetical protein
VPAFLTGVFINRHGKYSCKNRKIITTEAGRTRSKYVINKVVLKSNDCIIIKLILSLDPNLILSALRASVVSPNEYYTCLIVAWSRGWRRRIRSRRSAMSIS